MEIELIKSFFLLFQLELRKRKKEKKRICAYLVFSLKKEMEN